MNEDLLEKVIAEPPQAHLGDAEVGNEEPMSDAPVKAAFADGLHARDVGTELPSMLWNRSKGR
jgi:hypothetical protein